MSEPPAKADQRTPELPDPSLVDAVLDARGLACPMPLLKTKQTLRSMQVGQRLRVLATDAGSVRDFHAYAQISGHQLQHFVETNGVYEYVLQKC